MNMNGYPLRVRQNILPLSVASTLPEAFKEWFFTEKTYDNEKPDKQCGLCDKEDIRYQFQIRNTLTQKELWVGSQCILKFGLSVYDNDRLLAPKEAKKKLNLLTKKMQIDSCIKALETLATKESNEILNGALKFYKSNKCLTPKFAFVVFWKLNENKIEYHPSFFSITITKEKYRNDLRSMPTSRVHTFWKGPAQSEVQLAKIHARSTRWANDTGISAIRNENRLSGGWARG